LSPSRRKGEGPSVNAFGEKHERSREKKDCPTAFEALKKELLETICAPGRKRGGKAGIGPYFHKGWGTLKRRTSSIFEVRVIKRRGGIVHF